MKKLTLATLMGMLMLALTAHKSEAMARYPGASPISTKLNTRPFSYPHQRTIFGTPMRPAGAIPTGLTRIPGKGFQRMAPTAAEIAEAAELRQGAAKATEEVTEAFVAQGAANLASQAAKDSAEAAIQQNVQAAAAQEAADALSSASQTLTGMAQEETKEALSSLLTEEATEEVTEAFVAQGAANLASQAAKDSAEAAIQKNVQAAAAQEAADALSSASQTLTGMAQEETKEALESLGDVGLANLTRELEGTHLPPVPTDSWSGWARSFLPEKWGGQPLTPKTQAEQLREAGKAAMPPTGVPASSTAQGWMARAKDMVYNPRPYAKSALETASRAARYPGQKIMSAAEYVGLDEFIRKHGNTAAIQAWDSLSPEMKQYVIGLSATLAAATAATGAHRYTTGRWWWQRAPQAPTSVPTLRTVFINLQELQKKLAGNTTDRAFGHYRLSGDLKADASQAIAQLNIIKDLLPANQQMQKLADASIAYTNVDPSAWTKQSLANFAGAIESLLFNLESNISLSPVLTDASKKLLEVLSEMTPAPKDQDLDKILDKILNELNRIYNISLDQNLKDHVTALGIAISELRRKIHAEQTYDDEYAIVQRDLIKLIDALGTDQS